jgi:hypothetical protein
MNDERELADAVATGPQDGFRVLRVRVPDMPVLRVLPPRPAPPPDGITTLRVDWGRKQDEPSRS